MNVFVLAFVGVVVFALAVMAVNLYNGLVRMRHQLDRAWSNIDVILKQRFDEIPQLVQVLEQYASYEAGVIKSLVDARARYGSARQISEKIEAARLMSIALQGVAAIGEAYPDLKANQNFTQLQSRISTLENAIADRREAYNETVANFNTRIEQFPDIFVARFLNYQRQAMFQVSETERALPNLKMNLPKFNQGA